MIILSLAMGLPIVLPAALAAGPPYQWTGPSVVQAHLGQDNLPSALQASNGTLWLAWQTFRFSTTRPDIVYSTMTNGVWGSVGKLTSIGYNTTPTITQLRDGTGTIFLFWSQRQTNVFNIYYETFTVNQLTGIGSWSSSVHLTTPTNFNDTAPAATVGIDGTLWLFWQRANQSCTTTCSETRQLYYKTFIGGAWSNSEIKITSDANWNSSPSVVVTKDRLVRLVWAKGGQASGTSLTQSFIFNKNLNGSTWTAETQVTSPPIGSGDQRPSTIQDRNGTIWLFWARTSLTTPQLILFSKFSTTNGQTWFSETQMTNEASSVDSQQPAAVQGNSATDKTIHLFYSSDRANFDYDIWTITSPSISPIHDLGIVSMTVSPNQLYVAGLPGKASANFTIALTVQNYGDYGENLQATVTVTNKTTVTLGSQVQSQGVSKNGIVTLYYSWNTTGDKPSRYNVSVSAVSTNSTETLGNQADNTLYAKSGVWLIPWGDVDQDGSVTLEDVSVFFFDYGFGPGATACGTNHCKYFYFEDINNEGVVDIIDVGIAVRNYGTYT